MIARAWRKLLQRRRRAGYHSRFGGLWTDRLDAREELARRRAAGVVGAEQAELLEQWIRDGYAVLPGALAPPAADAVVRDVERAWEERGDLLVELGGAYHRLDPALRAERTKLVDLYVHSRSALAAALAPPIDAFLRAIFDRPPLLFQSLSFEHGSGQEVHQDTAYVVVSPPLAFAAAWIALEDVREGSGELVYYPGSHRFAEFLFGGGYRNWNRERDGLVAQERYHASLREQAAGGGIELARFWPRKGDVLLWSADLAHGGAPITRPGATRRSLVCHYCPAGARPYYFHYRRDRRARRAFAGAGGAEYASSHYDVRV